MTDPLSPIDPATLPDAVDVSDNTSALAEVRAVIDAGPYDATGTRCGAYTPPRGTTTPSSASSSTGASTPCPAFGNEWYSAAHVPAGPPEFEHHARPTARRTEFGYKDFIPTFTRSGSTRTTWASLFRRAGAQFVVPVAEHHDGFAMYDSGLLAVERRRDGPAARRVRRTGRRRPGAVDGARRVVSHRAEHWFFINGGMSSTPTCATPRTPTSTARPSARRPQPNEAFLEDWLAAHGARSSTTTGPQVMWFDWWIEQPAFQP